MESHTTDPRILGLTPLFLLLAQIACDGHDPETDGGAPDGGTETEAQANVCTGAYPAHTGPADVYTPYENLRDGQLISQLHTLVTADHTSVGYNGTIEDWQHNRNPFADRPEFAGNIADF